MYITVDTQSLLSSGESETVEFKEQWQDNDALRELAAFANSRGSTLLVGVADDGTLVGWHGSGRDLDALTNRIVDSLRLHPVSVHCDEIDNRTVLRIDVRPTTLPVACRGRYYHRVGRTAREVPPDELPRFLMRRTGSTWDVLPAEADLDTINPEHLHRFIRAAGSRLPLADAGEDPRQLLRKLDLLVDSAPTRAAILLFGNHPQAVSFAAHVRMGRFKNDITILDETALKGTLFDQLDAVMGRFRQYLQVRYKIPSEAGAREGLEMTQRREIWEYPLEALREAVVNALIHRDYLSLGNIEIRVYDDEVVITSPGELPPGVRLEELKLPQHTSIQRNPLLAQTFYYAGLVERWGTGTARLTQACREHGLPEPEFTATADRFTVTFSRNPYTEERLRAMGLTDRQVLIMRYAAGKGGIDNAEAQELTGVSDRTALRELNALTKKGLLKRTRSTGRATRYEPAKPAINPP